jgi:hypothetical protein
MFLPATLHRPVSKVFIFVISGLLLLFALSLLNRFMVNNINSNNRENLSPLINAIDNYFKHNNRYPSSIDLLVTDYKGMIPPANLSYKYTIHGKYYLVSFRHINYWFKASNLYDVYWSKTNSWYLSDFTEWPEY